MADTMEVCQPLIGANNACSTQHKARMCVLRAVCCVCRVSYVLCCAKPVWRFVLQRFSAYHKLFMAKYSGKAEL